VRPTVPRQQRRRDDARRHGDHDHGRRLPDPARHLAADVFQQQRQRGEPGRRAANDPGLRRLLRVAL
jgi:hypothetical protein